MNISHPDGDVQKTKSIEYHSFSLNGVPKYCLTCSNMSTNEDFNWYAIRVTYNREMKVKHEMDARHIENFLPMKYRIRMRGERRIKEKVPAIHNLIFIYTTRENLQEIKQTTTLPIRYIMNKETKSPIIIPSKQMQSFIAVSGSIDEQIVYLNPVISNFSKGDKVKITGGVFKGAEGYFMRIKGDRRVVVCLHGIAAVATTFVHPSLVEKI